MKKKQLFDLDQIEEVWVIYQQKTDQSFDEVCRFTNEVEATKYFNIYKKSPIVHVLMKRFQFRN
jgi:hypothetical protein